MCVNLSMLRAVSTPPQWFWSNHVDRVPEEVAKDSSSDDDDLKPLAGKQKGFSLDVGSFHLRSCYFFSQPSSLLLRIGRISVCYSQLPTKAYWGLLGPSLQACISSWWPDTAERRLRVCWLSPSLQYADIISKLGGYCQDIRRTVLTLSTHAQTLANFRNSSSFINQPIAPSSTPTTTSSPRPSTLGNTIIEPSIPSPGTRKHSGFPNSPIPSHTPQNLPTWLSTDQALGSDYTRTYNL